MKLWEAMKAFDEGKDVEWRVKPGEDGPVAWIELPKNILLDRKSVV